jgi:hypothetical protein
MPVQSAKLYDVPLGVLIRVKRSGRQRNGTISLLKERKKYIYIYMYIFHQRAYAWDVFFAIETNISNRK